MRNLSWMGAAAVLALAGTAMADYHISVETGYDFGSGFPTGHTYSFFDAGGPSPDTGWWVVTNTGTSIFSGTIGQVAVSQFAGDHSYSHVLTLSPGDSALFAVDFESSNVGGFNGPFGTPQPGVEIYLTGTITKTHGTPEAVDLHVFDRDIHSGVPLMNPFGVVLDNYVLQGGDPLGRDTGDGFEMSQANGHYEFSGMNVVPLPPAVLAGASGLLLVGGVRRFTRK